MTITSFREFYLNPSFTRNCITCTQVMVTLCALMTVTVQLKNSKGQRHCGLSMC